MNCIGQVWFTYISCHNTFYPLILSSILLNHVSKNFFFQEYVYSLEVYVYTTKESSSLIYGNLIFCLTELLGEENCHFFSTLLVTFTSQSILKILRLLVTMKVIDFKNFCEWMSYF